MASDDNLSERIQALERENAQLRAEIARYRLEAVTGSPRFEQIAPGLAAVLDSMPAMIGYWNKDLINQYSNKAYSVWFGLDTSQIFGKHISEVIGEERFKLNRPYIDGVLAGQPQEFERAIPSPDGSVVRHALAEYVPHFVNNEVVGFYVQVSDVSALKRSELALTEARKMAEEASRAKSDFLSNVSHELRTPLTSISGAIDLLVGGVAGPLSPESYHLAEIVQQNCHRLISLINDLLDAEKLAHGNMQLDIGLIPLKPLLEQALALNKPLGVQRQIGIVLVNDIPPVSVVADAKRLIQALSNLLSNAVKFSPEVSTVEVSVSLLEVFARIAISDSGLGIPTDFHHRIFKRFERADSSGRSRIAGTGLGLSITKTLIEQMGGRISFSSREGKGTSFFVDLRRNEET